MPGNRKTDEDDGPGFPATRWSLIARAGGAGPSGGGESDRRAALAEIFRRYQPALRAHLLWRRVPADRVDDLVQAFVTDRVIERNLVARADPARGGFRGFLVASLDHFVANQLRHDAAGVRSPKGKRVLSLDGPPAGGGGGGGRDGPPGLDPPDGRPAGDPFDVVWARQAMAEALRRTRAGCEADARADLWNVLSARLLAPALDDAEPVAYDVLAARHGYASAKHAANALETAKRRFRAALRAVLAEHVIDEAEVDRELAALGAALAAAPHGEPGE